ncbi:rhodanese-related sulfurtransferase [Stella humosa]|uniref:Rhodanese-related sulfurtransferase n=2 Tax=Stella humosa TaxID=94 RepID=A0A3N1M5K1_9PROT|nr:rhodanese-related sulfurtransferase [Stella humosa]
MSVQGERAAAVAATVARVRAIEATQGTGPDALQAIAAEVTALASQTALFPPAHFPVAAGRGTIYRLSEDADHRFALYASAGVPGKAQPPHDHTAWAAISGVYGEERNTFWKRTDDGAVAGRATLEETGARTVRRGNAVSFGPADIHSIHVEGKVPSLHLHMYGMSLEHLPHRQVFEPVSGTSATFPPPAIVKAPLVEAAELKAMLSDGGELALVDVREEGPFSDGHLLFAISVPLSRFEPRIAGVVPRRTTRIVLVDADETLAHRAAAKLQVAGYRDVSVLAGGQGSWAAAGYEIFSGVNVPSKAFGEIVEHACETPRMEASEVKRLMDAGTDMVVLDSRPWPEYVNISIPTGIDCPGAELVYRVQDIVKSPDTLVVVNCAGRTRSIIGAQSLINAGLPNRVVALKNGTMGWHLAGLQVDRGAGRMAPAPSAEAVAWAKARADEVGRRAGVPVIDEAKLAEWRADAGRTTFLFDVRTPEEFEAGHWADCRHAPGGQLVQATDTYAGVRGARIVLVDNDGVRATMTASWLIQMGWDAAVLGDGLAGRTLVPGPAPVEILGGLPDVRQVEPAELERLLAAGEAVVVDIDTSLRYRAGHVPGAWFAVRSQFATSLPKLPAAPLLVITSADGQFASLAAPEAARILGRRAAVLAGGTRGWQAAGLPLTKGFEHLADEPNDVWYRPYDRDTGIEEAMHQYLTWEVDLVGQLERDGDARFRVLAPA